MSERGLGAIPSPPDVRDFKIATVAGVLPEEFELDPVKVKNQGSVGSCVAHTLAEIVEWHCTKETQTTEQVSTDYIYGNRRNTLYKNSGMVVREAISSVVDYGDCLEADLSGNHEVPKAIEIFEQNVDSLKDKALPRRFTAYVRLRSDDEIKTALMNYGPVVIVTPWFTDIKYANGILDSESRKEANGAHCMMLYGWNKRGWLVQNSWGSRWGNKGRCIMPFGYPFSEAWGISDTLSGEDSFKKPYSSCIGKIIAKIVNALLRWRKK